jgi:hypothetical protein
MKMLTSLLFHMQQNPNLLGLVGEEKKVQLIEGAGKSGTI